MDLKRLRKLHLYLGCFFAPLILVFILTGTLQTFNWHYAKYGPPDPETGKREIIRNTPEFVKVLLTMHTNRGYKLFWFQTNNIYRCFVLCMAIGLFVTIILGVVMAFKYESSKMVWMLLVGGIIAPIILLLLK